MELVLLVVVDGVSHTVRTRPGHVLQWERRTKCLVSQIAERGLGMEDLLFLAWLGLRTDGIDVPKTLEAFADSVDSIELVGDDARPTVAAVSAE